MKKIITITLILFKLNVLGQGLKNLDRNYGINKFKLETPYSLYKNSLKYFDTTDKGVEFYTYTKSDIKEIFGIPVEEIALGFYENKLYTISIYFGIIEKQQTMTLLENINKEYDIPEINQRNNEKVWVAKWVTGKTYLQAAEFSCDPNLSYLIRCKTELFIYSKNLKRKIPNE